MADPSASDKPIIADNKPRVVALEAGKTYYYCACGRSQSQPFCDGSHQDTDIEPIPFTPEKDHSAWICCCKQTRKPPYCNGAHRHIGDHLVGTDGSAEDDAGES